ncbi:MAG: amidohydrolase [Anaerolineales bacterium]|nr:amidohydrolase [Anaerolineales bacterium]
MRDELVAQRRDLHRHPEIAFEEVRTAGVVARELSGLGLEVITGVGKTGVIGILEGAAEGPTVLIRCDMDALPVQEMMNTAYISGTPGKMHACGHDGHTAIGLAVAKMLSEHREQLAGRVKFIFQPAEELALGAQAMIRDGALDAPTPSISLGLHLWSELPTGTVSVTEGAAFAAANDFQIIIRGKGGHGAMPHQTRDPIVAGTQIVGAMQTIVSRSVDGLETAVVSVCGFHSGHAHNVIPDSAELFGTFRTYQRHLVDLIETRIHEIATGIAAVNGCTAEVVVNRLTPPLINDAATNARLSDLFQTMPAATPLTVIDSARTMASEDMAFWLERAPGTYFFVGARNEGRGITYPHHHPQFDIDEDALPIAAGLLAAAAASYVYRGG